MVMLASTSDVLRIVTGAAASITINSWYADYSGGVVTPSRPANLLITTATTTTIVASPGAGVQRNVRWMGVTNNSTTVSCQVTIQQFDGTNAADLMGVTLLPGENLVLDEMGGWTHHDSQGAPYAPVAPSPINYGTTGTLAETCPRYLTGTATTAPTSGTLYLSLIWLPAGLTVSNIAITCATAFTSPTNQFFALYSAFPQSNPVLLAQSANQTTTAWAANTRKQLAMTAPYKVGTAGWFYVGVMVTATTMGTLVGPPASTTTTDLSTAPIMYASSTSGLTTALPNPAAAAFSTTVARFRAEIS